MFKTLVISKIIASWGKCICHLGKVSSPFISIGPRLSCSWHKNSTFFPGETFTWCSPHVPESLVSFYDYEHGSWMSLAQFCWAWVPPSMEEETALWSEVTNGPSSKLLWGHTYSDQECLRISLFPSRLPSKAVHWVELQALVLSLHHRTAKYFAVFVTCGLLHRAAIDTWPFEVDLSFQVWG